MTSRPTLLFVHGTGVRGQRYSATLNSIKKQVAKRNWDLNVSGCYWGGEHGARLACKGRSIPTYLQSDGDPDSSAQDWLDLWAVLYTDPWYEIRLLREMPSTGGGFGQESPSTELLDSIDEFEPSPALAQLLREHGLTQQFESALEALRRLPELRQAAATAPADPLEHRGAIARALIAHTIGTNLDELALGGEIRDQIVETLTNELDGYGLTVGEYLKHKRNAVMFHGFTHWFTGQRGKLTDSAAPLAGDVLLYLVRGTRVSDYLRRTIDDAGTGPIVLLGHSLGGIMSVDLLVRKNIPQIRSLVTVGSQAPFLYEIGALPSLEPPASLPDHFPRWLNIYDRRDALAYVASGIFGSRVTDVPVNNAEPFPTSHSAYWNNSEVWTAIESVLG
ncbi:alpha/beta fold hydrolase [Nocardia concava]|uniref:alpha/beta fold hydrolase n=1 Tax=Nocardia concava TaxID=257281 RepID=UPI000593332A|nr:alpha/beta fold hydrolase [Nocardia concava]